MGLLDQAQAQTLSVESLTQWVEQSFEREVQTLAATQKWSDYQLDFDVRVPTAANHLPRCSVPLTSTGRDQHALPIGYLKRAISCDSPNQNWRINVTIRSTLTLPVAVVKTTVERDETLSLTHVALEKRTLNRGSLFFTDLTLLADFRATRRLRPGQVVLANQLERVPLVSKGNQVVITARQGDFSATMKGEALEEGHHGAQISVRNLSSNTIIKAWVSGRDRVETRF
ncbi:flagellar basal body P-ring formation protein FlgA [Vibrio sp. SM6]|uniref:Flagella basal body P-ring formation protein FlgA n=1 Tax=Vibrio agarilyticus TaxID=2726741 RepID=A0A7X8TRN9_9VIBR|nr:flagellar basal body P-ring formation chaperone FlgA [Vibrio agarilyticus]NLS13737.1 flagellar basal body P-ring formation protein FlgA [Vibrio agarilyticus]